MEKNPQKPFALKAYLCEIFAEFTTRNPKTVIRKNRSGLECLGRIVIGKAIMIVSHSEFIWELKP